MNMDDNESPESLFQLGKRFYLARSGVADPLLALYYFQKSAEAGHVPAQRVLGSAYLEGTLTAPDYKKALFWLTKAAQNNDAQAAYNLAKIYTHGLGVKKNWGLAYKLLSMQCASQLDEARSMKEMLKNSLINSFPSIKNYLETHENKRRSLYTDYRKRFILSWFTPGRPQFDEEEFKILLEFSSAQKGENETRTALSSLMDSYYAEQEKQHSPTGN